MAEPPSGTNRPLGPPTNGKDHPKGPPTNGSGAHAKDADKGRPMGPPANGYHPKTPTKPGGIERK